MLVTIKTKGVNIIRARSAAWQAKCKSSLAQRTYSQVFPKSCRFSIVLLFGQVLPIYG